MKLHRLIVNNIRGIKELDIRPDGDNFLIWGPNGSGKSGVIDSIDFLLTGQISRLTGRGTRGISLSSHGPHIDCDVDDAWVEGTFQIPETDELIVLKRSLKTPSVLEYDENFKESIQSIITIAQRGQHVLTRRDILRYIASDASTRAREIQELLNITEIENIRSSLVRVRTYFKNRNESSNSLIENSKGRIISITEQEDYTESDILEYVNKKRVLLKGELIKEFDSSKIKDALSPPALLLQDESVNLARLKSDADLISKLVHGEYQEEIINLDLQIRGALQELLDTPEKIRDLASLRLIELGLELIDETGDCPLCDISWPEEELQKYLESKREKSKEIRELQKKLNEASSKLLNKTGSTLSSVKRIVDIANKLNDKEKAASLQKWFDELYQYNEYLINSIEKYLKSHYSIEGIKKLFLPSHGMGLIEEISRQAHDKYPGLTLEQSAWDTLTEIETNLKGLENALLEHKKINYHFDQAEILYNSFVESRDEVLQALYDQIEGRFVDFYRFLHNVDEGEFEASIEPSGAGLKFQVDFHGRGVHPPQALHSEGHQDSMGICLWLALSEQLTQNKIDLILLDDVVMSIDIDHRRKTADMLSSKFGNRQFLITTHDRNWMSELKSGGIVNAENIIHFYDWDIDQGPHINFRPDMWNRINEDLDRNDVPEAAAKLRHGSEDFFRTVCGMLEVPVVFKENYKWELGELQLPAMDRYKYLIKRAIMSAESWDKQDVIEKTRVFDSVRSSVYGRTYAEQWLVNESLHYNNWGTFSPIDFRPVVDAFHDLFDLFYCHNRNCRGILRVEKEDRKITSLRCPCGEINWNLIIKPK